MNPFSESYDAVPELVLVMQAKDGSQKAMDTLIRRHQHFIYSVALKLVGDRDDAADLSQEAIIKMITKLNQFKGKSCFRTWLYRIILNHFIKTKKKKAEHRIHSFEEYGQFLDTAYLNEEMSEQEHRRYHNEIMTVRNNCISSMLLCLNRQQRIVFILGAIFNINSKTAAEVLNISADNFRQQLSRAKADLFRFMDNKCGLINPSNPCRCAKKTKGFIKDGLIDSSTATFKPELIREIKEIAVEKNQGLDNLIEGKYLQFFRQAPSENKSMLATLSKTILFNKEVIDLFRLHNN